MKAKLDIIEGKWSFENSSSTIDIGVKSYYETIIFTDLSWGWKIGNKEKKYEGVLESDQEFLSSDDVELSGEISLLVWLKNEGQIYEDTVLYTYRTLHEITLEDWRSTFKTDLYKLKIVLDTMGDLEAVEGIISEQPKGVQLAWDNANSIRRNSPTVAGLAQAMEYSDKTLDTIFKQADEVKL